MMDALHPRAPVALAALLFATACGGGNDDPVPLTTDTGTTDPTLIPVGTYEDVIIAEGPDTVHSMLRGDFTPYPGFEALGVEGQAQLVRWLDGTTEISVGVGNLEPNTTYPVHVHTQPCIYGGGPHYKLDPSIEDTVDSNELWPDISAGADGIGHSLVTTGEVRGDAMSVVIHDPVTNDKIACADLWADIEEGAIASGAFAPFAAAEKVDSVIAGTAEIGLGGAGGIEVDVYGLDPSATYAAHLHALPCDVSDGGGHYKFDPTVVETLFENEVWPDMTVGPDGRVQTNLFLQDPLREDAQSVVIHRVVGKEVPKVACADLVRPADIFPALETYGPAVLLASGEGYGVDDMEGTATVVRRKDGVTEASIEMSKLEGDAVYPVHLHDAPCSAYSGGDHYLIDNTVDYVDEANELWLNFTSKPRGKGSRTVAVAHLLRGEAQSFILHHADGARLACFDLD
mgnify:FL=1